MQQDTWVTLTKWKLNMGSTQQIVPLTYNQPEPTLFEG